MIECYLCWRRGIRGMHLVKWGKWNGYYRCDSERACADRIYRRHRRDVT